MTEEQNHPPNKEVRKKRAIIVVLLLPVFVVLASVWYGVRVALFGASAAVIEQLIIPWGIVAFILGILLGVVYIFKAPQGSEYWKVIVLSAILGVVLCGFLYPRFPEKILIHIAQPVEHPSFGTPIRLLLAGGVDGLALGVVIGLLTVIIDPEMNLTRQSDLLRYVVLSVLVAAILVGGMALDARGGFWDGAANLVVLILILVLKFIVR